MKGVQEMVSGEERESKKEKKNPQTVVVCPLNELGSLSEWFAQASEHNKQAVMTHPGL